MKKVYLFVLSLFMMLPIVTAENNKLYFTEDGDRLYYDTDSFNKDVFISNQNMVPGKEYKDVLIIENNTTTAYSLYLKSKNVEQSELSDKLIDSIDMKIYLDGELIYEGNARGLDYTNKGINLQDAILIGKYNKNKTSKLEIYTTLNSSYDYVEGVVVGKVDWEFYASYGDEVIPIVPDTRVKNSKEKTNLILLTSIALISLILYSVIRQAQKKSKNL